MIRTATIVKSTVVSLVTFSLFACGGSSRNAAPRLTPIPSQTATGGGAAFTLDLASFVTDREGQALTYTVVSGGGSFAGSVYSNMFDTLGTYPVSIRVTDALGKAATASFDVDVASANLAVITQGDNLLLLDTDTTKFLTVSGATGFSDTFRASLSTGQLVYERSVGGTYRTFIYDPSTRKTATIGNESGASSRYAAHTTSGIVVFTRTVTATGDVDLLIYNVNSGAIATISGEVGQADEDPFVSTSGLIFYERGANGQGDIYRYDPSDQTTVAISTEATDEDLVATLPNDGLVMTRVGGGGERDLFYFAPGTGLVEIGADVTALANLSKTYRGQTSTGQVVFEVTAATVDLYVWNPANGQTRAITDNGVDESFAGVNASNQILYNVATSGSNNDLRLWDTGTNASIVVSTDAANDVFNGFRADGDVIFTRETGTGNDLFVFDTAGPTLTAIASASADNYVFGKVLGNGKVAYTLQGASGGVFIVDPTTLTANTVSAVAGATFAGEGAADGDAVARVPTNGQFDLLVWDESAGGVLTVSNDNGVDSYEGSTKSGSLLFTRIPVGKTAKELFLWAPATTASTQLTTAGVDHTVSAMFAATVN